MRSVRANWQRDTGVCLLAGVTASHFVLYLKSVVESAGFFANEAWLEQYFRAPETFGAKSDDVFRLGAHRS